MLTPVPNKSLHLYTLKYCTILSTAVHYLDLIYSYSLMPTIYKPTRITKTSATLIDNILTNNENILHSAILLTDVSDHLPTILSTNLDVTDTFHRKVTYKRVHNNDNINKLKKLNGMEYLTMLALTMITISLLKYLTIYIMIVFH